MHTDKILKVCVINMALKEVIGKRHLEGTIKMKLDQFISWSSVRRSHTSNFNRKIEYREL